MEFTPEQQKLIDERIAKAKQEAAAATARRYNSNDNNNNQLSAEQQQKIRQYDELMQQQAQQAAQQELQKKWELTEPIVQDLFKKQGGKTTSTKTFMQLNKDNLIGKTKEEIATFIKTSKASIENVDMFNNVKVEANKVVEIAPTTETKTRYYPGTSLKKK